MKAHVLCSGPVFRKPCRVGDNVQKYCRAAQNTGLTMWRNALHAGHLRLQIHTQSIDFPLQPWLHESASVLRYTSTTLPVLLFNNIKCQKS